VADLTLSGESYETRAEVEPYFTREQIAVLTRAYLGDADPKNPLASPLYGSLSGLAPVLVHVGDDEVLLDDSRRYVERALATGVDARLDVWLGMAHGFAGSVGTLKASDLALDSIGAFLAGGFRTPANEQAK
jgi:acetyl esterase/lipase